MQSQVSPTHCCFPGASTVLGFLVAFSKQFVISTNGYLILLENKHAFLEGVHPDHFARCDDPSRIKIKVKRLWADPFPTECDVLGRFLKIRA